MPNSLARAEIPESKWPDYFQNKLKPFIRSLYLAVIVPGETLFVHGGISSKIVDLKDLEHPTARVEKDVLWSDPIEKEGEHPNRRGHDLIMFGPDITKNVCEKLDVKKIIRSHQPDKVMRVGGPFYSHGGRVLTISTTTVYGGEPFMLSINPADFSLKCDQILPDGSSKDAEIVSCKS
jgi:hypothetical protein